MTGNNTLINRIGGVIGKYSTVAEQAWLQHAPWTTPHTCERRLVNEYLRLQLGLLPMDTTPQRECLTGEATNDDYLRLFEVHVAPLIVQVGLPDWQRG